MSFHNNLIDDDIHALSAKTYADITARDADAAFQVAANLNKMVRIDTPASYYILGGVGPVVWVELSSIGFDAFLELNDTPADYTGQGALSVQVNAAETALEFGQALTPTSDPTFNDLTVAGDLIVNGTTTTINSATLTVDDKNIELGSVDTPTDLTADGGGITLKGDTDKTIIWVNATDSWAFNQGVDVLGNIVVSGTVDGIDIGTDVAANTVHRGSDGKDHSDVVLNNAHRVSDGKDHSDVVLNNTHRTSDGSNHTFIDQSVTIAASPQFAGLSVGGAADVSALVSLTSTAKGFLPPRMNETQRDAINGGNPATGLEIYNTDINQPQFFNGTAWATDGLDATILTNGSAIQSVVSVALETSFALVTGCSIVLPAAGTYRVFYTGRATVVGFSDFAVYRLFNVTDAVELPDTEGLAGLQLDGAASKQSSVTQEGFITVTGATTIQLEAKVSTVAAGNDSVSADSGRTKIGFQQLPTVAGVVLAGGDLNGPGSSTDNAVALFDGATGKVIKNSSILINGQTISVSAGDLTISGGLNIVGDLSQALTGTVDVTIGTAAVTGTGTLFNSELEVGSAIEISGEIFTVSAIASDTALTLDSNHAAGASGVTANTDDPLLQILTGDAQTALFVSTGGNLSLAGRIIGGTGINGNVSLGDNVFNNLTTATNNTGVGHDALVNTTIGGSNTAIGEGALESVTTGSSHTAIGRQALNSVQTAFENTAIGQQCLRFTTGGGSTAVGSFAMQNATTGSNNVAMGRSALRNVTGSSNVGIGFNSLDALLAGAQNIGIGQEALTDNITGNDGVAIGHKALFVSTGDDNVAIGSGAGDLITTGAGNICLGKATNPPNATDDNHVVLGPPTITTTILRGQVGLGTVAPVASAQLELLSTTKGFLPPRMTETQRDLINGGSPTTGLVIYNTTTDQIEFFNGAGWTSGAGTGDVSGPAGATDNAVALFDGATGQVLKNSSILINGQTISVAAGDLTISSPLVVKGGLSQALTGTVSVTIGTPNVTGSGAQFLSELESGVAIEISGEIFTVIAVISNNILTLDSNHIAGASGVTANTDDTLLQVSTGDQQPALFISPSGKIGIGRTDPSAPLDFDNIVAVRRISLWRHADNDHEFFGFGIDPNVLRYQVPLPTTSHVFFSGSGTSSSLELMRIQGDGKVGIGTDTPTTRLDIKGDLGVNLTGTVSVTAGFPFVTGVGTSFLSEVKSGSAIQITGEIFTIAIVGSDTSLTLETNHIAGASGVVAQTDSDHFSIVTGNNETIFNVNSQGQVSLNATPDPSALVDFSPTPPFGSPFRGFLLPKLDESQRDVIDTPATGLEIYNTDTNKPNFFDGSDWQSSAGDVVGPGSSVTQELPRFADTTGKRIQQSGLIVNFATGDITLTPRDTNGDINLVPNGIGQVAIGVSTPQAAIFPLTVRASAAAGHTTTRLAMVTPDGNANFVMGIHDGTQQCFFFNNANSEMVFGTNSITRMTVQAAGDVDFANNVGIGIDAPTERLHVAGSAIFANLKVAGNLIESTGTEEVDTDIDIVPKDVGRATIGSILPVTPVTWVSRTQASNQLWESVNFGNGVFVAVANDVTAANTIMTSPDGFTWTSRTPHTGLWNSVAYGDDTWIAVAGTGPNGASRSVDNGVTWISSPLTIGMSSVAHGKGIFTALGATACHTSSDGGITWDIQASPPFGNFSDIVHAEGQFVAVSSFSAASQVATSPDGKVWTLRSTPEDNTWQGVAHGNNTYVAVSSDGTNRVMTSPDGISWTVRTAAEANQWHSVSFGNGVFVAVSKDGTNRIMTSPDGITWTVGTAAAQSGWIGIVYANGVWVSIAENANAQSSGTISKNILQGDYNATGKLTIRGIDAARKADNIVEVFVPADMPNTLVANTKYVICAPVTFANGEEKTIPSGAKVEIASTSKFANSITYSGTGTFLSGTLISEFIFDDINLFGTKDGTLFNVSGVGNSTFNLILTDVRGWKDVGTLTTMGIGIVFQSSIILDNDDGIKIVDCGLFRIHRTAWLNLSDSGTNFITIDALTNRLGMSTSTVIPQGAERAVLINSSFVGEAGLNTIVGTPAGKMFDASGLDQTSIFVNAQQNQNLADSTTTAELVLVSNTAVTDIPAVNALVEINLNANWVGNDVERLSVATDGSVESIGLSDAKIKIDGNISLEPANSTKELSCRLVLVGPPPFTVTFTNGTNLINETSTALLDGNTISFRDTAGTLPAELRTDVVYYVVSQLTNSFQVSYTSGGAAIAFTDDGTPTNSYQVTTLHGSTPINSISSGSPNDLIPQATVPATLNSDSFLVVFNTSDAVDILVNSGYQRYFV